MILLVVNYHYIASEPPLAPRAIFPVTVGQLAAQLELLGRSMEFVSRTDLIAAVRSGRKLPERSCVVTFDDGLRTQFELGLPVLEALGIPGLFLVPGQPLAERRVLHVHKLQLLRERLTDGELIRLLRVKAGRAGVSLGDVSTEDAARHYAYDSPEAAALKYMLNVALPLSTRESLLAEVFSSAIGDEHALCDELYLSGRQISALEQERCALGAHSYAHSPLALLDHASLRRDLERSASTLERATGRRPEVISYPHGSSRAVTPDVAAAAAAIGFVVGFTMERAFNRSVEQPLLFGRVDANDAPGGSNPLLDLTGSHPTVRSGMTNGRERYFGEIAWLASSP